MKKTNTHQTLADYFREAREAKGLSMNEISKRTGLAKATVWKIENGGPVRANTLRDIAVKGLMFGEQSPEYAHMVALWVTHRGLSEDSEADLDAALSMVSKSHSKRLAKDALAIAGALSKLPLVDQKTFLRAVENPDALGALVSLARHFTKP